MPVKSMTGFGRATGQTGGASWTWEIRTVNNKGLDVRLRLPQGFEDLEARLRDAVTQSIHRGSCMIGLSLKAPEKAADYVLNETALMKLADIAERARRLTGHTEHMPLAALLSLKGVIEVSDQPSSEDAASPLAEALLSSFQRALLEVTQARRMEGERLAAVLLAKIAEIEALTLEAESSPERSAEAIAARLRQQIARLMGENVGLDENRLHQEAVLIATRADIEEELKRLHAHVAAARDLLQGDAPAGRRLEFLGQEFQREANTLCSKSNAASITRVGLQLKAAIDQLREQVQNVE
jgi:uncharacterized protein (TIGR00255 family)